MRGNGKVKGALATELVLRIAPPPSATSDSTWALIPPMHYAMPTYDLSLSHPLPDPRLNFHPPDDGIGTLAYTAPEAVEGPSTSASDVWSFGILLFEMVTGEVSNRGGSQAHEA